MLAKLFGGPTVQAVQFEEKTLLFRATKTWTLGQELAVKVAGRSGKAVKARVQLSSCRPLTPGGYVYQAQVLDSDDRAKLNELVLSKEQGEAGLRQFARNAKETTVQILGQAVRCFDISSGGLQVEMPSGSELNTEVLVEINPGLKCPAQVVWSGGGRAGLRFCPEDATTKYLLERIANGRGQTVAPAKARPSIQTKIAPPPTYENYN